MNTPSTFFTPDDYIYGYVETTDYEFMSDEELQALQDSIWGDIQ